MTKEPRQPDAAKDREARLKAALRANLARRKAQGRARASLDVSRDQDASPPRATEDGQTPENEE